MTRMPLAPGNNMAQESYFGNDYYDDEDPDDEDDNDADDDEEDEDDDDEEEDEDSDDETFDNEEPNFSNPGPSHPNNTTPGPFNTNFQVPPNPNNPVREPLNAHHTANMQLLDADSLETFANHLSTREKFLHEFERNLIKQKSNFQRDVAAFQQEGGMTKYQRDGFIGEAKTWALQKDQEIERLLRLLEVKDVEHQHSIGKTKRQKAELNKLTKVNEGLKETLEKERNGAEGARRKFEGTVARVEGQLEWFRRARNGGGEVNRGNGNGNRDSNRNVNSNAQARGRGSSTLGAVEVESLVRSSPMFSVMDIVEGSSGSVQRRPDTKVRFPGTATLERPAKCVVSTLSPLRTSAGCLPRFSYGRQVRWEASTLVQVIFEMDL